MRIKKKEEKSVSHKGRRAAGLQPKEFSRRGTENAEKRRGKISACLRATHRQAPERRGYSVSLAN